MAKDDKIVRPPTSTATTTALNGKVPMPVPSTDPKPKNKDKNKPDEPRDTPREIAETVVFVVVLVLMLKTFVAEAFVIPTGSMAETLYGYQKMVTCKDCGYVFPVNCSAEAEKKTSDILGCRCPNCEFDMHWKTKEDGPSWGSGDRVLVAKFLFDNDHLWSPKRGQVFVFKFPGESSPDGEYVRKGPQEGYTAMNYIKRCMGEPTETVGICGGDLYVTKSLQYPKDTGAPEDMWKLSHMHINDPLAVSLFKESIKRHQAGESLPGDFEIYRKPPEMCLAVRRIVFDNDFQPEKLKGQIQYRRWQSDKPDAWADDSAEMPKVFTHAVNSAEAWLAYGHRLRDTALTSGNHQNRRPENPDGFDNDPRKLIANMMGYNTGDGDANGDLTGTDWVGDLMLDCRVEVTAAQGEFVLELAKGIDRFQARFDVATGNCKLVRLTGRFGVDADTTKAVLAEKETKLKGTGNYHVRLANFDQRLTVGVDGGLPFGDGVAYAPPKEFGPIGPNDLQPARIGAIQAGVSVSHLQLWRDSYYTIPNNTDAMLDLGPGKSKSILTMYVQPGHYLALGDNSSASSDSRFWGLVPSRLLLGRALVVYYPITRMGWIR